MKLLTRLNRITPPPDAVVLLTERPTSRRGRSLWIGVSMAVLNLPRLIVVGLFDTAVVLVLSLASLALALVSAVVIAAIVFVATVIVTPVLMVTGGIMGGISGRLTDADDPAAKDQSRRTALFDSLHAKLLESRNG